MRIIKRQPSALGFQVKRQQQQQKIQPVTGSITGEGLTVQKMGEIQKQVKKHPFKTMTIGKGNALESIKIKAKNPKKFISFNMG